MKPFNLEEAKAGKPVVARDGRKVRLVCFDRACNNGSGILGLISDDNIDGSKVERVIDYFDDGRCAWKDKSELDIFMAPIKITKWINLYDNTGIATYETESLARLNIDRGRTYMKTVKIEWEE